MSDCLDCGDNIDDSPTAMTTYCAFCRRLHTPFGWASGTLPSPAEVRADQRLAGCRP